MTKIKSAAAGTLVCLAAIGILLLGCTDSSEEYVVDLWFPSEKQSEYANLVAERLGGEDVPEGPLTACQELIDRLGPPMTLDDVQFATDLGTDWDPARLTCVTHLG